MYVHIGLADALGRVFPATVASHFPFYGWIRQGALLDRSSVACNSR